MSETDELNLPDGAIVALPFFENEKFVVGSKRSGGMGNVYQLLPLVPGASPLALKTYHSAGDYEQFEREARIWISLGAHPNVARAITYGALNGVRCILAKWYPGNALDLDSRSLPCDSILDFASGIITGLKEGYEQHGLIHKDVKPSNILLDTDNAPRLSDFGISSIVPPTPAHPPPYANTAEFKRLNNNKDSSVSGTPIYMAPELFGGAKNSIKSDIFALGVTLFEWLTATHPYLSSNGKFGYARVRIFAHEMRQLHGNKIEPLIKLILLAIRLDPDERPATYAELLGRSSYFLPTADSIAPIREQARPAVFDVIDSAQVLRRQGKGRETIELLNHALEKRPDDVLLLTNLATTLIKLDKIPAAIPYLERAVLLNRSSKNRYCDQPYIEPNVNLALLLLSARKFSEAAAILKEASALLESAGSDLSLKYWEFGWLSLFEGRMERAAQRFMHYMSERAAIEPVIAMFCLSVFSLPNRTDYFRKCFDLISGAGLRDVLTGQYYCVIASYLDTERAYKFNMHVLTPKLSGELEEMSIAVCGNRHGFKVPMSGQMIRQLLRAVDDKYCGGKYRGII